MHRPFALLCLALALASAPIASAAEGTPNELYLKSFLALRKAEELVVARDLKEARESYRNAAEILSQISKKFPKWQKELVDYRRQRTRLAIARLNRPDAFDPETMLVEAGLKSPESDFVIACFSASQGLDLADAGQADEGRGKLKLAEQALTRLKKEFPDWRPEAVEGRLNKIKDATRKLPLE